MVTGSNCDDRLGDVGQAWRAASMRSPHSSCAAGPGHPAARVRRPFGRHARNPCSRGVVTQPAVLRATSAPSRQCATRRPPQCDCHLAARRGRPLAGRRAALSFGATTPDRESRVTSAIEQRLAARGPRAAAGRGAGRQLRALTLSGNLIIVAGQLPFADGQVAVTGRLGDGVSLEQGQEAARLCALNMLAQAKAACDGDLDQARRAACKLGGFVACTPAFTDHPEVVNGASDLMVGPWARPGRHARFAVGCREPAAAVLRSRSRRSLSSPERAPAGADAPRRSSWSRASARSTPREWDACAGPTSRSSATPSWRPRGQRLGQPARPAGCRCTSWSSDGGGCAAARRCT